RPQALNHSAEFGLGHVVLGPPKRTRVAVAKLARAFIGERDQLRIILAHFRQMCSPSLPEKRGFHRVTRSTQDVIQRIVGLILATIGHDVGGEFPSQAAVIDAICSAAPSLLDGGNVIVRCSSSILRRVVGSVAALLYLALCRAYSAACFSASELT